MDWNQAGWSLFWAGQIVTSVLAITAIIVCFTIKGILLMLLFWLLTMKVSMLFRLKSIEDSVMVGRQDSGVCTPKEDEEEIILLTEVVELED